VSEDGSPRSDDRRTPVVVGLWPLLIAAAVIVVGWGVVGAANTPVGEAAAPEAATATTTTATTAAGPGTGATATTTGGTDGATTTVAAGAQGDPVKGEQLFKGTCAACHGPDARGLPGLGKNLRTSEFVHSLSDAELVAFVEKGRDTSDPMNTTGIAMPPRGGNPKFSEQDLYDIVAYLRTLG